MNDRDFLFWIHERMVWQGNDPHMDYMHKLRAIIKTYPAHKETINRASEYPMEYPPTRTLWQRFVAWI